MVPLLGKRWLSTISSRRRKRTNLLHATTIADEIAIAAASSGTVTCASLIRAVEKYVGVTITTRIEHLGEDCVGFTDRIDDQATITISSSCTTRQHTLAHELGHLALGHEHCATPEDFTAPEVCEELWRYFAGQLDEVEDANEAQAEAFAERIVKLLPDVPQEQPHEVKVKAALLR